MNAAILIPSLNPDHKLVDYVKELSEYGFSRIIVVNDGSSSEYDCLFERCTEYAACILLKHGENKGKGEALKTGMRYYLENSNGLGGIVTGDADGQHALDDTAKIAELLSEHKNSLLLGSRDFEGDHVPARSKFGNKTTSSVFKLFYGQKIGDTQTGLRGIPNSILPLICEMDGSRFEYETNMLIQCILHKIPIVEIPVRTIYLDENSSSHFNPLTDSFRIYRLLIGQFFRHLFRKPANKSD